MWSFFFYITPEAHHSKRTSRLLLELSSLSTLFQVGLMGRPSFFSPCPGGAAGVSSTFCGSVNGSGVPSVSREKAERDLWEG